MSVYLLGSRRAEESHKSKCEKSKDLSLKSPLAHFPHLNHLALMGSNSLKNNGRKIPAILQEIWKVESIEFSSKIFQYAQKFQRSNIFNGKHRQKLYILKVVFLYFRF